MARTALPLSTMTASSPAGTFADLNDAGTTIDATNGMTIALTTTGVPATSNIDRLILYVANTAAATKTVTIKAGASNPPAFRSGEGDYTTGNLNANTGTAFIGPFDVSRFMQSDGSLSIDFASGTTGTIWAIPVSRAF